MKRLIGLMVLALAVGVVGGCKNNKKATDSNASAVMDAQPAPQPVPYTPPAGPAEPTVVTPAPEPTGSTAVSSTPAHSRSAVSGSSSSSNGASRTKSSSATGTKSSSGSSSSASGHKYTVKEGDTLTKIAKNRGTTVSRLQKLNPTIDPDKIRVGQKINVP